MHVNLDTFDTRCQQLPNAGLCPHGRDGHESVLKGRTSPAKEYPSDVCRFFARVIADFGSKFVATPDEHTHGTLPSDAALARLFMPLDPYLEAHNAGQFGTDFADYSSVTERRKAEKKLRKKEERERALHCEFRRRYRAAC